MALNPTYCAGCEERGTEVGVLRAENVRLRTENRTLLTKLSLTYAKTEALEAEVARLKDMGRRDVIETPLLNRAPSRGDDGW